MLKTKLNFEEEVKTTKLLNNLFAYAIDQGAETIRLDPGENDFSIFYEMQGEENKISNLSFEIAENIILKIKELVGLELERNELPQLKEFKKNFNGCSFLFSLIIKPAGDYERLIIEIRKQESKLFGLKQLGLQKNVFEKIKETLDNKKGMLIVVGTFNSGKTTTLYSCLNYLSSPEISISTIEDKIFYDIPFVSQHQVDFKKGFDFGTALRALEKQNTDIVMIEEMNDYKTVESSFHLSEKGHFILAGVYSQDVFTNLNFLRDLGLDLKVFKNNVKVVLNQRLIKKMCPYCVSSYKLGYNLKKDINKYFEIEKLLEKLKKEKLISEKIEKIDDIKFYKNKGCDRCGESNFDKYVGVFELLEIDDNVKQSIKEGHLSKIKEEISNQGYYSLEEDALIKAINGIVSIGEVLKLIKDKDK